MLGRLWPRLALEACFLAAVALAAGLLHLSTIAIVVVMFVAWLITAAVEWKLSRKSAAEATATAAPVAAVEPDAVVMLDFVEVVAAGSPEPVADEDWLVEAEAEPEPEPEPEPLPE